MIVRIVEWCLENVCLLLFFHIGISSFAWLYELLRSFSLLSSYLSSLANGPSHLLETLSGIKKDHREIVKQVEELKEAQNAFVTEILKDLNKLEEAESRLVAKIGGEETLQKE